MSPIISTLLLILSLSLSTNPLALSSSKTQTLTKSSNVYFNHKLPQPQSFTSSKKFEGSSDFVNLKYHMGPVLSNSPINIYIVWYGSWSKPKQTLIKDFLNSLSAPTSTLPRRGRALSPSVEQWWQTVAFYADQTNANVTNSLIVAGEYSDSAYSHGRALTRLTVQEVISSAVKAAPFPADHKHGIYLVLTSDDVKMQDFCRAVCGFHYFTFPSMVGYTLPYAWIGDSGKQCAELCAYPFAIPSYMNGVGALKPPNNDVGVDGMLSVIAHELAELATNPLVNAWYAGEDPTAPTEIGDLCEGVYGSGGGGGYTGQVMQDRKGRSFNVNGVNGRRFLVQWIWNPFLKACSGPNSLD